jgi:rhamnulose-1-phosphate aldolase/alcohol dehydrogenase
MTRHQPLASRWDESKASGFSEAELLLYRSQLLGADLAVTNYAGGNTSAKLTATDPLSGEEVGVLWVKGSGGDLGSMKLDGFATLYLDKLLSLERLYRGREHEDEMVALLPHCTFALNPRAASIDTPLHAFLPHRQVDHMHPDAVIALAASRDGETLVEEIFEGELAWLPWQRPGFDLGLRLRAISRERPGITGIVLGGHGLFTWGECSHSCYDNTLRVIRRAAEHVARKRSRVGFGGVRAKALAPAEREAFATELLPPLRGALSKSAHKLAHFDSSPDVLEFVGSVQLGELARAGTSCPDHFLRTKIRPLVLDLDPAKESAADLVTRLAAPIETYRAEYTAYYERNKSSATPPLRDASPVVVLVPGVGMFTFAADKVTARIAGEFYVNAIHVMRGASDLSAYVGLDEREAFRIEYWALEEAKLKRMPPPKPLAGRIALVTGGAGGIGRATAERLLAEGACVTLADLVPEALAAAASELASRHGADRVREVVCDVTSESSVVAAVGHCVREFGGLDVLVASAGIASSAPFEETSLESWNKAIAVLATGYFLFAREAFKVMKAQALGGSIVFVGSKNALAASTKAAAYNTAKAAELHLARSLALEGAPLGIRVNVVNPDAVLRGSRIWSGEWRSERARAYGIGEEDLEAYYRSRSLLGRSVYPEDVAEAIAFFASERSSKSTGNVINVDAGNVTAFPR